MKVNWIPIVERKNSLLFQDFLVQGSSHRHFKEALGVDYAYGTNKYVDGRTSMDLSDLNGSSAVIAAEIEKDEGYYAKFAEMCYSQARDLIETSARIGRTSDLAQKRNPELDALFEEYAEAAFHMIPFLIMANVVEFMFQDRLAAMLKEEARIVDDTEIQNYLRKLVIPDRESLVAEEIRDMLEIGVLIQRNESAGALLQEEVEVAHKVFPDVAPDIWGRITGHVEKFAWMNTIGYLGDPMTTRDVVERLKHLARRDCAGRLEARRQEREAAHAQFNGVVENLNLSADFVRLAEIAGEYIYLRIYRMDAMLIGHHNVRPLLGEIARRMGVKADDILYMTHHEIQCFLRGMSRPSENEINRRREGYALVMLNRDAKLYTGDDLAELKAQEPVLQTDYSGIRVLPGTPASLGEWTGTARIVREPVDMDKVGEGDVLVSIMTTPDLILAMERSGAIVTDEGGMLCHAAIVSRELGIPCVIGTKTATLAILDGDTTKVTADELEGMVEILERKFQ